MEENPESVKPDEHSSQLCQDAEIRGETESEMKGKENADEECPEQSDISRIPATAKVLSVGRTRNSDTGGTNAALLDVRAESEKLYEEFDSVVRQSLSSAEKGSMEAELGNNKDTTVGIPREEKSEDKLEETAAAVKSGGTELNALSEAEVQRVNGVEVKTEPDMKTPSKCFLLDPEDVAGNESGSEEDQETFMKELETFHRERGLDFKPPKFYQEPLNCLKLWRAVIRLGGYERVTSLKLWRQVGESFRPPKTCTTVSWTFRGFYEKALLEYEKQQMRCGELPFTDASLSDPISGTQVNLIQSSGSGRARRNAAARAMQGWHSQRRLSNGEVGEPILKDQIPTTIPKREKQLKNIGFLKRKGSGLVEQTSKLPRVVSKPYSEVMVMDVGMSADWVKVNVQRMKDCYEVYALVPGLLREEVRVQTDPAGRLVISGQPEQQDNPWGVTPFRKVVSLPTRIDAHHTSAVVTLHGQLFVRVPVED